MLISDWISDVCSSDLLQYLLVRAVEARIDQSLGAAGALAGDAFKMALARGGAFEGEGRGQEDRRLQRAFGQHRVEAIAHHQRRGRQRVAADLGDVGLGLAAWGGAGEDVRSEEHTSELQSLMRISEAGLCLKTTTLTTIQN